LQISPVCPCHYLKYCHYTNFHQEQPRARIHLLQPRPSVKPQVALGSLALQSLRIHNERGPDSIATHQRLIENSTTTQHFVPLLITAPAILTMKLTLLIAAVCSVAHAFSGLVNTDTKATSPLDMYLDLTGNHAVDLSISNVSRRAGTFVSREYTCSDEQVAMLNAARKICLKRAYQRCQQSS